MLEKGCFLLPCCFLAIQFHILFFPLLPPFFQYILKIKSFFQGIGVVKTGISNSNTKPNAAVEKKPRPQKEQALNCPRCNSTNTKFCYYNNYSLSQPRYFCKTCRRYWTEGGSLRNVPVGGGSRKNKRPSAAATVTAAPAKKVLNDLSPPNLSPQNPKIQDVQDLNLTYNPSHYNNLPLMELLKTNMNPFMCVPISNVSTTDFSSSSGLPEPAALEYGFGNFQGVEDQTNQSSRILFPFEEVKRVSNNDQFEEGRGTHGYWNGMISGGW